MQKRIVALILAVVMLASFCGCNRATSARNAVELFEIAMNENDFRQAFAYVATYDGFGFSGGSEEIMKAVASKMRIDIVNESVGSTSGTIDVDITTVDLRKVYSAAAASVIPKYYQTAVSGVQISADEIGTQLVNAVVLLCENDSAPTVTTRCTLQVTQNKKGKWEIILDTASYNAITGYLDEANNMINTGSIIDSMSSILGVTTAPTTAPTAPPSPSDTAPTQLQPGPATQ